MNERARISILMNAKDAHQWDGVAVCRIAAGDEIDSFLLRDLSPALRVTLPIQAEAIQRVEFAERMLGYFVRWVDGMPVQGPIKDPGPSGSSPGSRWRS